MNVKGVVESNMCVGRCVRFCMSQVLSVVCLIMSNINHHPSTINIQRMDDGYFMVFVIMCGHIIM